MRIWKQSTIKDRIIYSKENHDNETFLNSIFIHLLPDQHTKNHFWMKKNIRYHRSSWRDEQNFQPARTWRHNLAGIFAAPPLPKAEAHRVRIVRAVKVQLVLLRLVLLQQPWPFRHFLQIFGGDKVKDFHGVAGLDLVDGEGARRRRVQGRAVDKERDVGAVVHAHRAPGDGQEHAWNRTGLCEREDLWFWFKDIWKK